MTRDTDDCVLVFYFVGIALLHMVLIVHSCSFVERGTPLDLGSSKSYFGSGGPITVVLLPIDGMNKQWVK
jgi:hypothetical protein